MRNFIGVSLLCLTTVTGYAQTTFEPGTIQLGGAINYSQDKNTTAGQRTESQTFYVAPAVGYFVAKNLAVGVNATFSANTRNFSNAGYFNPPSSSEVHTRGYEVGPFVQYYRMVSEKFGVTGRLGANYVKTTSDYTSILNGAPISGDTAADGFYALLTPSLIFFPIPSFGLSASIGGIGYSHNNAYKTDQYTDTSDSSSFGASFGLSQFAFSGTYYFMH